MNPKYTRYKTKRKSLDKDITKKEKTLFHAKKE